MAKLMTARWDWTCTDCGYDFWAGEAMVYDGETHCIECRPEFNDELEKKEPVLAGFLWDQQVTMDFQQNAWDDTAQIMVPLDGEYSEDEIRAAIDAKMPRQSSWGQLRWRSGADLLSIEEGYVIVQERIGIAD